MESVAYREACKFPSSPTVNFLLSSPKTFIKSVSSSKLNSIVIDKAFNFPSNLRRLFKMSDTRSYISWLDGNPEDRTPIGEVEAELRFRGPQDFDDFVPQDCLVQPCPSDYEGQRLLHECVKIQDESR